MTHDKALEAAIKTLVIAAGIVHSKLAADEGHVTIIDQLALKDALAGLEPFLPIAEPGSARAGEHGELVERLRLCADDPMWADHAEVPKAWLREAVAALSGADAEIERLRGDRMAQIDYGIDLQRFIEDLFVRRPIRQPQTTARHHYDMAVAVTDRIRELEAKVADLLAAVENIAEGNLGDEPWQANYANIKEVARAAAIRAREE